MKTDIQKVKYNPDKPKQIDKCIWWAWKETCDRCGKLIMDVHDVITTSEPSVEENDYCYACLFELLDERKKEKNNASNI